MTRLRSLSGAQPHGAGKRLERHAARRRSQRDVDVQDSAGRSLALTVAQHQAAFGRPFCCRTSYRLCCRKGGAVMADAKEKAKPSCFVIMPISDPVGYT